MNWLTLIKLFSDIIANITKIIEHRKPRDAKNAGKSQLPYEHLIVSASAKKLGIDNTPNDEQIKNLQQLNLKIYIPIKMALERMGRFEWLRITSGFRSPALNKAVGGSVDSDHMRGLALDLVCADNDWFFETLKSLGLPYKQLIRESIGNSKWCHISLDLNDTPKRQNLEAYKDGEVIKYRPI